MSPLTGKERQSFVHLDVITSLSRKIIGLKSFVLIAEKEIERRKSRIKYYNKQFCSLKCYHEFNRGKNHCRWTGYDFRHTKEWEEARKRILERDGYKCFLTRKIDDLCIHHIIPWYKIRKNLDSYLITLTRSSHMKAEEELKHFRRENENGFSPLQIKFLSYTGELQYLES